MFNCAVVIENSSNRFHSSRASNISAPSVPPFTNTRLNKVLNVCAFGELYGFAIRWNPIIRQMGNQTIRPPRENHIVVVRRLKHVVQRQSRAKKETQKKQKNKNRVQKSLY